MGDDFVETCQRKGDIRISNVSFSNSQFISKLPDGDYKTDIKFYDDEDKNVASFWFMSHISH